jgi:hypothetical protein
MIEPLVNNPDEEIVVVPEILLSVIFLDVPTASIDITLYLLPLFEYTSPIAAVVPNWNVTIAMFVSL